MADQKGGFDCKFVKELPPGIQSDCPVCLLVLREPYQVTCCGYGFCRVCIERVRADNKPCPCCNAENFDCFEDKGRSRSLNEYDVYCTNKNQGCQWIGGLGKLEDHVNSKPSPDKQLEGCPYTNIPCIYCSKRFQRSTIEIHQSNECPKRPFSCRYCKDYNSTHKDVIENHWPVCGSFPVQCPKKCSGETMERRNLKSHIDNDCPLTIVDCEFKHIGCEVRLPRKSVSKHLKEGVVPHMLLQNKQLMKLKEENKQLKQQVQKLTKALWPTQHNDKAACTTILVSNSDELHFTWEGYGLHLYIPESALPPEIEQCTISIKATVEGNYVFPKNSHLVSAVYWFYCDPKCQFSRPIILEIQHCAKEQNLQTLSFMKATTTEGKPEIKFSKTLGCCGTNYGVFPSHSSYGFIFLDKFCGYGVVQEGSEDRQYRANIYYLPQSINEFQIHFTVLWNTEAHHSIIKQHYLRQNAEIGPDMLIEFDSERVSLDIPTTGITTEGDTWKIIPLFPPEVTKIEVDSFDVGKRIPSCQLLAIAQRSQPHHELTCLIHPLRLLGTKSVHNYITLFHPPANIPVPPQTTPQLRLTTLLNELTNRVSAKWEEIGISLRLESGLLEIIKKDNPSDCRACLREVLKEWLKQIDPPPSWVAIIEAVKDAGYRPLARTLREKY